VIIIPFMLSWFRSFSAVCAIVFQSWKDMFSDAFMNGFSIFIMLQIFEISGEIVRMSSTDVHFTAPDFGSKREEIVPPVIISAMFGSSLFFSSFIFVFSIGFTFSRTFTLRMFDSFIPML